MAANAMLRRRRMSPPDAGPGLDQEINDKKGGNNFKLPHTGIRKAMRADGWDI